MRNRKVRPGARMLGLAMLAATAAAPAAAPSAAWADDGDAVKRGEYLVILGDCGACHTASGGQKFAGGRLMEMPFGTLSTPNITPDKDTGIGNITDDQFYRVFHEGIGQHGEHLYPAMPYPWYRRVTRDDVLAIKAYLFSLQPVHSPRAPSHVSFPFDVRAGLAVWDTVFLSAETFKPDPAKSAELNRGTYLVEGLGHCGECHNGQVLAGDTSMAGKLQGGVLQDWYAPNITSDPRDGIGKYSDAQLYSYLKTGVAEGMGVVAGPMAETVHESLSKFHDDDLRAVVAYLRSTKPVSTYENTQKGDFTGKDPVGRQAYLNNCASCHQLDGKGIANAVPPLAGNGAVLAKGPENVIRAVWSGIEAQGSYAPMPAVGYGMSDQDIADVTNYVRQAWGNQAPPTAGPGLVAKLRASSYSAMTGGPDGKCPELVQPKLQPLVADPKSGIEDALKAMTLATVTQTADALAAKVKQAAPDVSRADVVNGLTIAYCPVVQNDPNVPPNLKVAMIGHFSERLYSSLKTEGKE